MTREEEHKWSDLYDCRDEITRALQTVHRLENELEQFDDVLLSEELNVLLRKQEEMELEMSQLQRQLNESDSIYGGKKAEASQLQAELELINAENDQIVLQTKENDKELDKLESKVNEKKK